MGNIITQETGKIYNKVFTDRKTALVYLNDPVNEVLKVTSISTMPDGVEANFYISDRKYQEYVNAEQEEQARQQEEQARQREIVARNELFQKATQYIKTNFTKPSQIGFIASKAYLDIFDSETLECDSVEEAWIQCEQNRGKYSAIRGNVLHTGGRLVLATDEPSEITIISNDFIKSNDSTGVLEYLGIPQGKTQLTAPGIIKSHSQVTSGITKGYIQYYGNHGLSIEILGTTLVHEVPMTEVSNPLWAPCNMIVASPPDINLFGHIIDIVSRHDEAIKRCAADPECVGITMVSDQHITPYYLDYQLRHRLSSDALNYKELVDENHRLIKAQENALAPSHNKLCTSIGARCSGNSMSIRCYRVKPIKKFLLHGRQSLLINNEHSPPNSPYCGTGIKSADTWVKREWYSSAKLWSTGIAGWPAGYLALLRCIYLDAEPIRTRNEALRCGCDTTGQICLEDWVSGAASVMLSTELAECNRKGYIHYFVNNVTGAKHRLHPQVNNEMGRMIEAKHKKDEADRIYEDYCASVTAPDQLEVLIKDKISVENIAKYSKCVKDGLTSYIMEQLEMEVFRWIKDNRVLTERQIPQTIDGYGQKIHIWTTNCYGINEEWSHVYKLLNKTLLHLIKDTPNDFLNMYLNYRLGSYNYQENQKHGTAIDKIVSITLIEHIGVSDDRTLELKIQSLQEKIKELSSEVYEAAHKKTYDIAHIKQQELLQLEKDLAALKTK